ncbi:unnamed protein product, partial [Clonostachys rosea]
MSLFALPTATYKAIPWQCGRRRLQHQLLPIFTRTAAPSTASARPQFHQRTHTMAVNGDQGLRLKKFQTAIHEFDKIVLTTKKLLVFANNFSIPVHTTTQTVAKLGPTVPSLASLLSAPAHDKTKFS